MSTQKLTLLRLQKQQSSLDKQPIPHVIVTRKGLLNFHFCIYGLDGAYKNGVYHGVLQLAPNYPFAPPRLLFLTPSGRFQTNKPICTSFTNFHKQTWTAGWNVRTMATATLSFMTSDQHGVGGLNDSYGVRQQYAQKSWGWNMNSQQFRELFEEKLRHSEEMKHRFLYSNNSTSLQGEAKHQDQQKKQIKNDNKLYLLIIALVVLLIMWLLVKIDG